MIITFGVAMLFDVEDSLRPIDHDIGDHFQLAIAPIR